MRERVLVTGATGFIGSAVSRALYREPNVEVLRAVRTLASGRQANAVAVGDLSADVDWTDALEGVTHVIHCAARVHQLREVARNPLAAYRMVNVKGTLELARQAAVAGVQRFVFLSSIKVLGECTEPGRTFAEEDAARPVDPYGLSKWEAEEGLLAISREHGMQIVILRPVAVYGPGVRGNLESMLRWLKAGLPLPLGSVRNLRSVVGLGNLVSLIGVARTHPKAANQVFHASDSGALSTPELIRKAAAALGVSARLIPVPTQLVNLVGTAVGRQGAARRLLQNLVVPNDRARRVLGWEPPFTLEQGLAETAEAFLAKEGR